LEDELRYVEEDNDNGDVEDGGSEGDDSIYW
jgi:hypothetical protein